MMKCLNVGKILGVPILIHWSLFVVFFLGCLLGWGAVASLFLLYVSVVVHEFAHSLVAKRYGATTKMIILSPLGGMAMMEDCQNTFGLPEAIIAIAGPIASGILGGASILGFNLLVANGAAITFCKPEIMLMAFSMIAGNITMAVFNLIPAIPMDGGRIIRGLATKGLGLKRATSLCVWASKVFAIMFVLLGAVSLNVSLIIVGVFIWWASKKEQAIVDEFLKE